MEKAESKTITLIHPIGTPGAMLSTVTLRPPRFEDFMELGECEIYVPVGEGKGGFVEVNLEAVRKYIIRLCGKDTNLSLLDAASLEDSMRLRDAVLGFFRAARSRIAPPPPSIRGSSTPALSDSTTASPSVQSAA